MATTADAVIQAPGLHPAGPDKFRDSVLHEVVRAISRLSDLKPGWDSYGGALVEEAAQKGAVRFVTMLFTHLDTPVVAPTVGPSADGGVILRWLTGEVEVTFKFFNDVGEYDIANRENGEILKEGVIGRPEALIRDVVVPHILRR